VSDVLNAFPDISFTLQYSGREEPLEKAIYFQKKYQNVAFMV
jgi:hypothetical protein